MRVTAIGNPQPYQFFGTFAGLSFWPGGLSLLAAAPGIGKTSWLLRMVFEAARQGFPAALGCYEHTSEELKYRLHLQGEAATAGAHSLSPAPEQVEALLAQGGQAVLLALSDQDDTVRAIEEILIQDYNFPVRGPALLAMDYLQHPSTLEIAGTERGLKLRLYAAPGYAQGAAQSWAAMTNQQTRWQRVECPPQRGGWQVLKTHARVPSLAVSPGDAFLAVGGQLLGQARNGQETALRIWVLGRDDHLQECLRALASYAYGTEGGVGADTPNPWGLRLALLRFVLVFGIKWSRSRRPLIVGVSGGSTSAGWMLPVTGAIGVLGGGLITFAAAAGMLDWMQWRSIPKEVVERRVNDTLLKISFSARTCDGCQVRNHFGCQVRNHFPQKLSLLSAPGKWETVDAVTTNSDWPAVRAFAMPLPAVEVAALVTPPEAGEGSGVIDRDSRQDVPAPPPSRPLTEAAFKVVAFSATKIGKSSATGEAIGVDPDGHGLVTGGSRTGKTSFAYALLERLIERGEDAPGIFLVDPHVSLADAFLEAVNNLPEPQRSEGIRRLRIITPDQPEVVPLNLLAVPDFSWAGNAIVPSRCCAQIGRRIWEDYWGPRMQAALLGLSRLEQKPSR